MENEFLDDLNDEDEYDDNLFDLDEDLE